MAVRPHHGHDGGIVERRLRPIFDWLDNGNNKKALQEAEKVLKKSSNLQAAKALKALALLRLGKESEAHVVLDTLAEEKPTDDTTLQAMMIFYRESHQLHKMCALYEAAVKMEPTREEHHSNLFMSYVRVGDYLNQHRAAMALYKVAPKNPYYFWAVMSVVLQAKSTDNNTKKSVLLSLAERMVDNFITEKKMEAEQEARLYIMILELQEKWEVILKFMEGPIYQKLLPGAMPQASIPYLRRLGQWRKLNLLCKELLWEHLDRWDYYLPYFDSVFQLIKESSEDDGQADDTLEKCHEFICSLVENMGSKTMRGPYLARLELWRRLSETGEAVSLLGSGVALCVQYLRAFAHKPCVLPDLRPYLAAIPQKEREEHCRHFLTCLDMDENTAPQTLEEVQRHVNCLGAWRLTAPVADASTALAVAESLRARYNEAADRGLAAGSITEFGPTDQYALMAAHHYCYVAFAQQSSEPVVKALTLLDTVLQLSPANFHVKLLLVQLYHLLGNALAADSVYQRLDVKHVQLVSLGWTHAARLAPGLAPRRALALLADTNAFYTHHANDSVEQLTAAYKYGTFEKLCELDAWRTRLQRCAWCALVARERALLALLAAPPAPLHAPPPRPFAPHTDNRDLNAIVSWEPGAGVGTGPELRARSAAQEEAYLDIKDSLVSAMALCVELAADRSRERYDQLKTCVETLEATFEKSKQMYGSREKICISAPFPSRIIALVNSPVPYRELYSCAFTAAGELALGELSAHDSLQRLQRLLTESAEVLGDAVRARMSHADPLWNAREAFEDISNHLELLVIVTFVVGVCHELLGGGSGGGAAGRRRRRAAAASPQQGRALEALRRVNEATQAGLALLEELMEAWPAPTLTPQAAFDRLRVDDRRPSPPGPGVEERLRYGHQDMLDDLKDFLRKKSKYLKSLVQ